MALGPLFSNELSDLQLAQLPYHPGTEHQSNQQRRQTCQCRPHGDIPKHVERMKIFLQHVVEEVEEHFRRAPWACRSRWNERVRPATARNESPALRRFFPFSRRAILSPAAGLPVASDFPETFRLPRP